MPQFEVYFFGLICHFGTAKRKERAFLVDEPLHYPSIAFDQQNLYHLDGDVTFSSGTGPATVLDLRLLPSLQKITKRNDGQPVKFSPHPPPAPIVYYPTGASIFVADVYDTEQDFYLDGTKIFTSCVARVTAAIAEIDDTAVQVRYGNHSKLVPSDGFVFVLNYSKDANDSHIEHHIKLTDADLIATLKKTSNTACKKTFQSAASLNHLSDVNRILAGIGHGGGVVTTGTTNVECSATGWP